MIVGVLGGGQLSLMLAEAGRSLEIDVVFIDPAEDACAAAVASQIKADYDDPAALADLARQADVVTHEFENVPSHSVELLSKSRSVYPAANALAEAQDRLLEKNQFVELGIPVPKYLAVDSLESLQQAVVDIGLPAVLKTRRFGYDGKGQAVIKSEDDVALAWQSIGEVSAILEAFMPFDREISIIAVRDQQGDFKTYPISENTHQRGVLHLSLSRPGDPMADKAESYIRLLLDKLEYVGVLALELFQVGDELYANEIAPRVHNSGHWTIEGSSCSQFENHMRAVAGLPLGDTNSKGFAAMLNCIGEMPDTSKIENLSGVVVHDYGKAARKGRKVGHITVTADNDLELGVRLNHVNRLLLGR